MPATDSGAKSARDSDLKPGNRRRFLRTVEVCTVQTLGSDRPGSSGRHGLQCKPRRLKPRVQNMTLVSEVEARSESMHQSTWLPLVTGMSALALATEDQWRSVANSNPEQIASALGWDLQTFQQLRAQFGIGDLRRQYLAQLPRQAQQGGMATTSGGYAHPAGQFPAAPTRAQWSQQQQPVPGPSIQSPSSAIQASPAPPTFRGIRNCVWQGRGSIANGTVVLLPQMHWARTSENNPEAQEATLVSQGSILRDLVQNGARNIFLEDFNPESVERFNQTHLLAKDDQQYAQKIERAYPVNADTHYI
jgi:hypothetical protein